MTQLPTWAGTLPGWITAVSSGSVAAIVLYGIIKHGPDFLRALNERRQQSITDSAARRGENRSDLAEMRRELDLVKAEVSDLKLKLLGAITANKIMDLEIETHMPGSTALGQARAVLKAAFTLSPSTVETAQ